MGKKGKWGTRKPGYLWGGARKKSGSNLEEQRRFSTTVTTRAPKPTKKVVWSIRTKRINNRGDNMSGSRRIMRERFESDFYPQLLARNGGHHSKFFRIEEKTVKRGDRLVGEGQMSQKSFRGSKKPVEKTIVLTGQAFAERKKIRG